MFVALGLLLWGARAALAQTPSNADWRGFAQLSDTSSNYFNQGSTELCTKSAEQVQAFVQQRFPARLHFYALMNVASARTLEMKYEDAMTLHQQVLEAARTFRPQDRNEAVLLVTRVEEALRGMAYCLSRLDRTEEAIPYLEACVDYIRKNDNKNPLIAANCQKQLALMYRDAEKWEQAEQTFREAAAVYEREYQTQGKPIENYPHLLSNWGVMYEQRGRSDLAEPLSRRALNMQLALTGWQHTMTAEFASNLGMLYTRQGRHQEGRYYVQRALNSWEQTLGPEHVLTMIAVHRLAMIESWLTNHTVAEQLWRRSLAAHLKYLGAEHPDTADQQICLGVSLVLQKRFDEAEPLFQQSLATLEKIGGGENSKLATPIIELAGMNLGKQNYAAALPLLDRLEKLYALFPPKDGDVTLLFHYRATAHWHLGQRDLAVKEMQLSLNQREVERSNAAGTEVERARRFAMFSSQYEQMANWQAELGNLAEMFRTIERSKARSFLDELRLRNVDVYANLSPNERQKLQAHEQSLREQLLDCEKKIDALASTDLQKPGALDKQRTLVRELQVLQNQLYEHLSDARAASPIYRKLITDEARLASLENVQKRLGDGELMLAYLIGEWKHSYVLAIRRDSVTATALEVDRAAADLLGIEPGMLLEQNLNTLLLGEDGLLAALSQHGKKNPSPALAGLWQVLIPAQVREDLISGKVTMLTVLPDGGLSLLPFESLVVADAGTQDPRYLLDVGPPIVYAPSATVLGNLADRQAPGSAAAEKPVFTLGDPAYSPIDATAAAESRKANVRAADRFRAGLARLPYTGWESTWVEQMFSKAGLATIRVTGAAATEAAIRQHAPGREIIHLACHGMADQSYGNFFGSLAVAPGRTKDPSDDGFLSMAEIYQLKLDACELAILSACETNFGPQQQGEGVWALSRGFLVAGARRVIASNWVVDDKAGATLVSYFATYLTRGGKDVSARDYAKSLHEAKRQVRREDKWAHPFYWSSLVLVGPK